MSVLLFYNLSCLGVTEPFLASDVPGESQFTASVDSEENALIIKAGKRRHINTQHCCLTNECLFSYFSFCDSSMHLNTSVCHRIISFNLL